MPDRVATTLSPDVLAAPVARPAGTPASSAVPLLAELPDEMRRQIPALAISGAVYSDNPAQRLLLINGQVLAQGSAVTADVRLEEIREHHAVLNFKGTRFRVAH
jgi:general secretion pathway protein B